MMTVSPIHRPMTGGRPHNQQQSPQIVSVFFFPRHDFKINYCTCSFNSAHSRSHTLNTQTRACMHTHILTADSPTPPLHAPCLTPIDIEGKPETVKTLCTEKTVGIIWSSPKVSKHMMYCVQTHLVDLENVIVALGNQCY